MVCEGEILRFGRDKSFELEGTLLERRGGAREGGQLQFSFDLRVDEGVCDGVELLSEAGESGPVVGGGEGFGEGLEVEGEGNLVVLVDEVDVVLPLEDFEESNEEHLG